jgi:glycogen(starch) synthase
MLSWEFPPRIVGGLARHVHDLTRALAESDVATDVVTVAEEGDRPFEALSRLNIYRVKPSPPAARDFVTGILQLNVAMLEKVMALVERGEKYDLLHAHDWLVAFAARALKHALKLPLVSTIHATEYGRNHGLHTDEQRYISDVEWWLTYEAWKVICCSRYMCQELQRVFQLPPDKIRVVSNGVDLGQCGAGQSDCFVRQRFAADDERIVFFVGRLVREKGVHLLLEAAPRILSQVPKLKFVIAGRGPALESLQSQVRRLGLETQVHFAGHVDDTTRNGLYRAAAVAVFPSMYEPFGIVALEAMAAKVPVVVADTGGLAEIVVHGVDGLKCYAGHAASLADQVLAVLNDPALAGRLAENAFRKAMSEFSWQEIARQTRNIYQEVLSESRRKGWLSAEDRLRGIVPLAGEEAGLNQQPARVH